MSDRSPSFAWDLRELFARGERREAKGMTQRQLAAAIGSNQSRVATLESATADVTVDLMLKARLTVGG